MRLLLAEDDVTLGESLRRDLAAAGYAVDWVRDGAQALDLGTVEPYDLVVLDLGMPGRQGLEVLRAWRAAGMRVPVLVLTARDAWHERVDGFKAGADDYLGKPFHFEELSARLAALGRRSQGQAPHRLGMGDWHLDEERQALVHDDGREEPLTGIEFRMLRCFLMRPGKVLSKAWLLDHVYEGDREIDSNVIEVYINRLRRKLGAQTIATRRGQGYVLVAEAA
ncbi:MAG: response regulator transcription factor [Burkholderiales bacterium]|nr:response regulator transcription factor [Burkholderiales bacterium]